ncbi:MAG TPA: hypothetical protein VI300_22005, partial [Solirubrobacter sp.]
MSHPPTAVPPETLTQALVRELADLYGGDDAFVRATVEALGLGSRVSLIAHGIIDEDALCGTDPGSPIVTEYGRHVIELCVAATYGAPARDHAVH